MIHDNSGFGIDRLGSGLGRSVDGAGANEPSISEDLVLGGPGRVSSGGGDSFPNGDEAIVFDPSFASMDGSGDDPLKDQVLGGGSAIDDQSPRIFGASGVDSVDSVCAHQTGTLSQGGIGQTGSDTDRERREGDEDSHHSDTKKGLSRTVKALLVTATLIVVSVMAFAILEPIQVLPRIRLAPGFSFVAQDGSSLTSEDGRGVVTLYAFEPAGCGVACHGQHETMAGVMSRRDETGLAADDFRLVTVALDVNAPQELSTAADASGADGDIWRWVGADPEVLDEAVGAGFRVYFDRLEDGTIAFDPTYVIVDGQGLIRGEYTYATLASDVDRLTRHLSLLGEEIRNADGRTALLYEAAHVFLCYP